MSSICAPMGLAWTIYPFPFVIAKSDRFIFFVLTLQKWNNSFKT